MVLLLRIWSFSGNLFFFFTVLKIREFSTLCQHRSCSLFISLSQKFSKLISLALLRAKVNIIALWCLFSKFYFTLRLIDRNCNQCNTWNYTIVCFYSPFTLSLFNYFNSSSLFDTKYWELMFLDSFYDDFKDFAWVTTAIPIFSLPKSHTVSANLATVARFSVSLYCVHLWTHAI